MNNEKSCCAHLHVVNCKIKDSEIVGHILGEYWMCQDCDTRFVPDSDYYAALEREEKLKEELERIHNLTDFQECYGYKQRAEAAEAKLAEMTTNRDQWERNSAAENKRAGDALVKLAVLQVAARDYLDNHNHDCMWIEESCVYYMALCGLLEEKT